VTSILDSKSDTQIIQSDCFLSKN